ncbi:hypothetical protein KL86DES1_21816 [uncultured Desulfovibrio sp.]|uniref:Uncharacterized protein n=1 Tax=uncultured Desulfovibrio sp. TaxID=167968 RepID=A0A212L9S6_9BACT|nr:hypothetical protein KL86DES1_21816 [uncultured Desulfovibrio sp.]VZH34714.1 conserved protein of unknown function [Desulfovibrio sp. 86]
MYSASSHPHKTCFGALALMKRAVISFGKARSFFEAGVDSSVLDCFKKSEATPPNEITARFLAAL